MEMKMNYDSQPMDAAKATLRVKFIAVQDYLGQHEKSQINNLTL